MGGHGDNPRYTYFVSLDIAEEIRRLDGKKGPSWIPVFISLKGPPFVPLKANSIGSITKQSLQKLGVDTTVWKAHSTRGAGVAMYKSLGFTSEEVCELGKWKNVSAFTSNYLRLNATYKVGSKIS